VHNTRLKEWHLIQKNKADKLEGENRKLRKEISQLKQQGRRLKEELQKIKKQQQ